MISNTLRTNNTNTHKFWLSSLAECTFLYYICLDRIRMDKYIYQVAIEVEKREKKKKKVT